MVDLLSDHGFDHGDVIRHLGGPWQVVANHQTTLAMGAELGLVTEDLELLALQLGDGLPLGEGLRHCFAVEAVELGFVVEGFQMRGTSRHAQEDDPLRLGREVRRGRVNVRSCRGRSDAHERGQGCGAKAESGLAEKGASCLIEAHRHLVPVGEFVEVEESAGNGGPRGEIGR